MVKNLIFYFWVTNSNSKNIKLHVSLLTRKIKKKKIMISTYSPSRFRNWNEIYHLELFELLSDI